MKTFLKGVQVFHRSLSCFIFFPFFVILFFHPLVSSSQKITATKRNFLDHFSSSSNSLFMRWVVCFFVLDSLKAFLSLSYVLCEDTAIVLSKIHLDVEIWIYLFFEGNAYKNCMVWQKLDYSFHFNLLRLLFNWSAEKTREILVKYEKAYALKLSFYWRCYILVHHLLFVDEENASFSWSLWRNIFHVFYIFHDIIMHLKNHCDCTVIKMKKIENDYRIAKKLIKKLLIRTLRW